MLAPWGLLLGCQHYLHPLLSPWGSCGALGWGTGLRASHPPAGSSPLPPLQRLALSTCMRGTLLLFCKTHDAGCGRALAVDPGNTHPERRCLSVPNSPGEDSGVGSYSSRSSQGLGHPTMPPGLVLPSPQARMDKGTAGDHEDGGWPGLPSSLPGPAAGECAERGADHGCPQLEIPLRLERRGVPWPSHPSPILVTWQLSAQLCSHPKARDPGTPLL